MPRDGSNIYHLPVGTPGISNATVISTSYNNFISDIEADLNVPRPIVAGGTGASSATGALSALGGEKAAQVVTNYDSNVFIPGSFYSATSATNPPVASHAFAGIAYYANATDFVVQARDLTDPLHPVYTRVMSSGVWGSWALDGFRVFMTDTPPTGVADGSLWWESDTGSLYLRYRDPSGDVQWVMAVPPPDYSAYLIKAGDAMLGQLTLVGDPVNPTHAADKHYVDTSISTAITGLAPPTGSVRYDTAQSLTTPQQVQSRQNINAFGKINVQTFTASATYTPSANLIHAVIECVGGGGGGGGVAGATSAFNGGGGGGGGSYARKTVTAATIGASQAVTIGAAGAGGTAGNNAGVAGGDTSVGTLCIGKGGSPGGGVNAAANFGVGGAGGIAGTGDLTVPGQNGGNAAYQNTAPSIVMATNHGGIAGLGFGVGGIQVAPSGGSTGVGVPGKLYGGGGSGASFNNVAANAAGGAGAPGIVIITEYLAA